jgi:hypothetical protein
VNCWSLAEQADPFIKRRLLALADRYEGQISDLAAQVASTRFQGHKLIR